MKEFEKLWNENDGDGKEGCKWYWKAALEWIKYAGVLGPSLANDLIDEELGD